MTALSPRRTFSGTALKTIACITMLVDHIGASCIEAANSNTNTQRELINPISFTRKL